MLRGVPGIPIMALWGLGSYGATAAGLPLWIAVPVLVTITIWYVAHGRRY